ncbi:DMT family transporter [Galbitalea soli]|uniref:DMT family transporter n=1 Tax=Galbitalea soli TaxID=1268042 RepID=A0A7C9PNM5_9MICO|nr:DMT family transporter [Galbitalea soli]
MIAAIVVTVVAWASAFVVIRATGAHFGGGALALGRLLVGSVVLGVVVLLGRRWVRPTGREWLQLAAFGLCWFGAYNVGLNIAEQTLDAGTTAMLVGVGPVLIALGAGLFLGEGLPRWLGIGAAVAFAGVILIGVASGVRVGSGAGILWCLLAALTYATGVLFQKVLLRRLPAAQVTWLGCTIGAVACLPFAGQLIGEAATAPAGALLGVAYLGAIPTALAFSTWAYALTRMPAGQLGVTTYIVPSLTILLALAFFREVPPLLAIAGGVVCLVGVALSRRRPRPA